MRFSSAGLLGKMAFFGAIALAMMLFDTGSATAGSAVSKEGYYKDIKLWGKVKIVESFPDIKVQIVTSFPDLYVKPVSSFPDAPGKWQFVESFEDFKIKFVTSFPDIKIQFVESFPGVR